MELQPVVLNLVLNGMDAFRESASGERTLVLWAAGESSAAVRVAVRDSGTGIDETEPDRIFQAFCTSRAGGPGMGPAMARFIVEAHGGRPDTHNDPGSGATFPLVLPVRNQEP